MFAFSLQRGHQELHDRPQGLQQAHGNPYTVLKKSGKLFRGYVLSWNKVSGIGGYQLKRTIKKSDTATLKPNVILARYAWKTSKTVKVQIRTY